MCECGAILDERDADVVEGGGRALCATGAEDVEALPDMVAVVSSRSKGQE
jgi:hypothetical protein